MFDGANLSLITSFLAFDPNFTGGVPIAAADVNGDSHADIIAGAGLGGSPTVKIFSGVDDSVLTEFLSFEPGFTGGVYALPFRHLCYCTRTGSSPQAVIDLPAGAALTDSPNFLAHQACPDLSGSLLIAMFDSSGWWQPRICNPRVEEDGS